MSEDSEAAKVIRLFIAVYSYDLLVASVCTKIIAGKHFLLEVEEGRV